MKRSLIPRLLLLSCVALFASLSFAQYLIRAPGSPVVQTFLDSLDYWVIDDNGKVLSSSTAEPLPSSYNQVALPSADYPTSLHPWGSPSEFVAVSLLQAEPRRFLVTQRRADFVQDLASLETFYYLPALLAYFLVFGAITTFVLWRKRRKAEIIMAQMARGDFKARFTVRSEDESGRLMQKFNQMADEVETLVGKLKSTEAATSELLEGLAEDIRGPLKGLRSIIGVSKRLKDPFEIQETMEKGVKHMTLFERMIENLFLLAQVRNPEYRASGKEFNFVELLNTEINELKRLPSADGKRLEVRFSPQPFGRLALQGEEFLLRQLLRKLIENGLEVCTSSVEILLKRSRGKVELIVRDDGPGFSSVALKNYGKKRQKAEDGDSLGLGSVVVREVTLVYGGTLTPRNMESGGAEVVVCLPFVDPYEKLAFEMAA